MAKFGIHVATNKVGSECTEEVEVEDEELAGMTDEEKLDYVSKEYLEDAVWNMLDTWITASH